MKTLRLALRATLASIGFASASITCHAQTWTDMPAMDTKSNVVTQRADSPIYSRMATDKKFRDFAYNAINVRGEKLNYELVLESRAALFSTSNLRKVYETRAGTYYVSYWVKEGRAYRSMPFRRNAYLALIVVDTVPADQSNPQFKAVASKLPYAVYQIKWEQPKSNDRGTMRVDDSGSAVKWNCKTKDGRAMPTMLQTMIIHKPNFEKETEYYHTAYYVTDDGQLKDNGWGKSNICTNRSVGPDDEVSKWVRFFGGE
ncbi:hypothetical protein ACO0K9_12060 [Undibacterium sp. Ji50W]|uniref:hypothetical protein n=1 Tax=Undibacterium sp. Ji50W TaxID=3413041 RepID=UPI003BF2E223